LFGSRAKPATHKQSVWLSLPVVELESAWQSMQVAEPTFALYFPATQAVHCVFSPVYPRLQIQAVIAVCPVAACPEFAGQDSHTASDAAPI
jgi:hypothetical protein